VSVGLTIKALGTEISNCNLNLSLHLLSDYLIDCTNHVNDNTSSFTFVTDSEQSNVTAASLKRRMVTTRTVMELKHKMFVRRLEIGASWNNPMLEIFCLKI
jgi:hypothetical protein